MDSQEVKTDQETEVQVSAEYLYLWEGMSTISAQLQSLLLEIARMQMRAEDIFISGPESTREAPRMAG